MNQNRECKTTLVEIEWVRERERDREKADRNKERVKQRKSRDITREKT